MDKKQAQKIFEKIHSQRYLSTTIWQLLSVLFPLLSLAGYLFLNSYLIALIIILLLSVVHVFCVWKIYIINVIDDPSEIIEVMKDPSLYPAERAHQERNIKDFCWWLWDSLGLGHHASISLGINFFIIYLFIRSFF